MPDRRIVISANWLIRSIGLIVLVAPGLIVVGCADSSSPPTAASTPPPAVPTQLAPAVQNPPAVAQAPVAPPAEPQQQPAAPPVNQPPQAAEPTPGGGDASKPRPILGRTTNEIRDAEKEQAKGAQRAQSRITGNDVITLTGNAYISIVGRAEQLNMQHTLDLYHAETGRYPKDLNEFMREIVKKSGVRLAQLPFYQEYAYDSSKHELVILEYPELKKTATGR